MKISGDGTGNDIDFRFAGRRGTTAEPRVGFATGHLKADPFRLWLTKRKSGAKLLRSGYAQKPDLAAISSFTLKRERRVSCDFIALPCTLIHPLLDSSSLV
jgi:hypothetical protein